MYKKNKHYSSWSLVFLLQFIPQISDKEAYKTCHIGSLNCVILDPWTVWYWTLELYVHVQCDLWSVTKLVRLVLTNIFQFPNSSHVVFTYILYVPFINYWIIFPCSCTHSRSVYIVWQTCTGQLTHNKCKVYSVLGGKAL